MHVLFILLALFAQDAQDPTQEKGDPVDALIQALKSDALVDQATESQLARDELIAIGRPALPKLVKALKGTDSATEPRHARTICEILGRIRHNSDEVVAVLIGKLKDRNEFGTSIAAAAAGALGRIGDPRAVQPLIEALKAKDSQTDEHLKYECVHWLGIMRAKEAVDAILPALESKKKTSETEWGRSIAAAAADALGRIGDEKAVEALCEQLERGEKDASGQTVGVHVARALEKITGEKRGNLHGDPQAVQKALKEWQDWHKTTVTTKRIAEVGAAVRKYHE
ncbi:MAG: HEAT repeat domain-containing protein, partial [Planctomycetota bacterium]